jgi:hypothetical protein
MNALLSPVFNELAADVAKTYPVVGVTDCRAKHAGGYFVGSRLKTPIFAQSSRIKSLLLAEFGVEG